MTFDNVNTEILKNAINNCINSINYSSSNQIITDITNNGIWSSSSRDNFKRSMETLVSVRYKELENKLKDYLNLVNLIEKYKTVSGNISNMQMQLAMFNDELSIVNQNISNDSVSLENNNQISEINCKIDALNKNIGSEEIKLASLKGAIESLL